MAKKKLNAGLRAWMKKHHKKKKISKPKHKKKHHKKRVAKPRKAKKRIHKKKSRVGAKGYPMYTTKKKLFRPRAVYKKISKPKKKKHHKKRSSIGATKSNSAFGKVKIF